tara:strand:+ start:425 stop:1258 length:834 start_codon:yes stop_codon:yes gene_type:complete
MKIIRKTKELENLLDSIKDSTKSIGLVLTMGNIHEGHVSLIKEAKNNNDFVVTSIFVNPTQFNNKHDYNSYPKTIDEDIEKLKSSNCDLLYLPFVNEIYPKGLVKEKSILKYRNILCDITRPGHFDGVTTVVNTFFNIIKPKNSYFGEKDYQQMKLINEMVKLKKLKINIISCPSIRDNFGMSLSSRNSNFNSYQLEIFQSLGKKINLLTESLKQKDTKINYDEFKNELSKININKIDYLEIRDESNLEITNDYTSARLFVAVYIDDIRIIDNFKLY